jgi:hypothetical protein
MKSGLLMTAALVAAGVTLGAQENAAPRVSPANRRDAMRVMEGVLTASVKSGAAQLSRKIQAIEPSLMVLSGEARARGFMIDGYGVFFDVEIPAVSQSVVWSVRTLNRDRQVNGSLSVLRQFVDRVNDPATKAQLDQALRRLEQQVGAAPTPAVQPAAGLAVAATTSEVAPVADLGDPNEQYTEAVKRALIDAMLDYSASMKLGPEEWLTIAASDSQGPLMPGQLYDATTTILRVKGSDLSAYQIGKISREEALKKVEVREF